MRRLLATLLHGIANTIHTETPVEVHARATQEATDAYCVVVDRLCDLMSGQIVKRTNGTSARH